MKSCGASGRGGSTTRHSAPRATRSRSFATVRCQAASRHVCAQPRSSYVGLAKWTADTPVGRNIRTHNTLVEHSLIVLLALSFFGGGGDIEHGHDTYLWPLLSTLAPELQFLENVGYIQLDQCMAGLTNARDEPIRKRTRIFGTVPETRRALEHLQCTGAHVHGRLEINLAVPDGFESKASAVYPPGLATWSSC